MTAYSQKQNAVRAARKALADGSAPAPTYEIKSAKGGGFRIVWDHEPPPPKTEAVERDEDIDTNEPDGLSPADEKLADGLRGRTEPEAAAATKLIGHAPENAPKPKAGTQLTKILDLLKRTEGATIAELQAATGWLPHTTRAFISVQVRRKAGLEVATEKVEGRGRVYRVAA